MLAGTLPGRKPGSFMFLPRRRRRWSTSCSSSAIANDNSRRRSSALAAGATGLAALVSIENPCDTGMNMTQTGDRCERPQAPPYSAALAAGVRRPARQAIARERDKAALQPATGLPARRPQATRAASAATGRPATSRPAASPRTESQRFYSIIRHLETRRACCNASLTRCQRWIAHRPAWPDVARRRCRATCRQAAVSNRSARRTIRLRAATAGRFVAQEDQV
ncbi:MAG: hypothetical protein AW07_04340 [Candidatus Accumulibacter sp. SK-11]|nr:MAG: hypothetical protein AW07_04340 [Candidatus Accumulibacter sp. SK-11]